MTKLNVVASANGYYSMEGELSRHTIVKSDVLSTLHNNKRNISSNSAFILDMSGVTHTDTAGLAWLMNFLKNNLQHNIHFEIKNIPESLMKLAKISDVDGFLSVQ